MLHSKKKLKKKKEEKVKHRNFHNKEVTQNKTNKNTIFLLNNILNSKLPLKVYIYFSIAGSRKGTKVIIPSYAKFRGLF